MERVSQIALGPSGLNPVWTRRDLLRLGGGVVGAAFGLGGWWARAGQTRSSARSCVLVYLLGGPSQIDMFDLKPGAPAEIRGPFRPIATTVPGLSICEHLPRLAARAHRYALVRSVSHPNHNHTPMIYYTLTGRPVERPAEDNDIRPPQRTDAPHLGAVIARAHGSGSGLPPFVAIPGVRTRSSTSGEYKRVMQPLRGGGAGFLGALFDPLEIAGDPGTPEGMPALSPPAELTVARLERRAALLDAIDRPGASTVDLLRRQAVLLTGSARSGGSRFALDDEPRRLIEAYGENRFGRSMLLARRLVEAGVPTVAIHWNEMTVCDGWDTHARNFEALEGELLPMLDRGLSALLDDLDARGLLDSTLVVVMGEFGRTPRINKDAGRDHWGSCQTVLLAGGGVRGGVVIGASDRVGAYPTADPVDPVDIHATIYTAMGVDPEAELFDPLGRPFVTSTGRVIPGLLG
ncbi:MAG: hypothetical protein KatS3mg108_1113 [Isosphaeraceae bacterium]|nr:MAG: hypothetical protein KatS3mg108_1113 [Isosphaeraceae bacterium]